MKKIIFFLVLMLSNKVAVLAQSITLIPNNITDQEISKIKKEGVGFSHESPNGLVKLGTWVNDVSAFVQTHSNHPIHFATNNGYSQMTLLTNGNFGIGINPSARLHVDGFTKLGIDAPAIKMKKFTGNTATTQGGYTTITHGLPANSILSISVVVNLGAAGNVFDNYTQTTGYQIDKSFEDTYIYIWNSPNNSANILNKAFQVLVTYWDAPPGP